MNKSPAFQWYPRDILSSARVQELTLEEEGAYRRLLDFCWLNGSIPSDPDRCARLIGKGASICIANAVQKLFTVDPSDSEKLIHDRLEIERDKQESNRNARKAASEARWGQKDSKIKPKPKQTQSKRNANAMQMESSSTASSSSDNNTPSEHSGNAEEPLPTKKTKQPNPFYEEFQAAYFRLANCPYVSKQADFIQLAKCKSELDGWLTIDQWKIGVRHYFQSEIGEHTLADLSVRFSVFFKSPLDRFKQPIAGNGHAKPEVERRVVV